MSHDDDRHRIARESSMPPESLPESQARIRLIASLLLSLLLALPCIGAFPSPARAVDLSDLNRDGEIGLEDLMIFSNRYVKQDWQAVDWCVWLEVPHKQDPHFPSLLNFIWNHFQCGSAPEDPLAVRNTNDAPTRLAWGADGKLYVSDARIGSVFIYERQPDLTVVGELKSLQKPLGVAVDAQGNIYVGNNGRDNVEVYAPDGSLLSTIGAGSIQMPNDLALDSGNLYVVDSRGNRIWIYDASTGDPRGSLGVGQLNFPVALEIAGSEIYVADQSNYQVKVFDLQGNLLRSLGSQVGQGMMGYSWRGRFVRLQSLVVDGTGRLHTLDSQMGVIQILNAISGSYITDYGTKGSAPGQLNLPLDLDMNDAGEVAVADNENKRVEILTAP
jgi:hypothetical protein